MAFVLFSFTHNPHIHVMVITMMMKIAIFAKLSSSNTPEKYFFGKNYLSPRLKAIKKESFLRLSKKLKLTALEMEMRGRLTQCKNNLMTFNFSSSHFPFFCVSCRRRLEKKFLFLKFFSQFCLFTRISSMRWWRRWLMICDFRVKFCNSIIHSVIVFLA